jgi:putative membrane protein
VDVKRTPSNVPLSIHCHLREWFSSCLDAGVIRAPYDGMMAGNLTTLRSVGNDLYRIRTTPTPFAYQAHLRMITILFLIFFPLTMFETLGWSMVFAAALLAFIYFGLLDIARDLYVSFPFSCVCDRYLTSISERTRLDTTRTIWTSMASCHLSWEN